MTKNWSFNREVILNGSKYYYLEAGEIETKYFDMWLRTNNMGVV